MPKELISYQNTTNSDIPTGRWKGCCHVTVLTADMTAKGQCLFKVPFLHFLHIFQFFPVWPSVAFRNHSSDLRFCLRQESSAHDLSKLSEPLTTLWLHRFSRSWVDALSLVSFNHLDGWKMKWNVTKSCWRNNKSHTTRCYITLNMASERLVGVVCTACGKTFANRWAYNQHCTNRYLERTDCYTMQSKHSMQQLQTEEETCPPLFSTVQGQARKS